MKRITLWLILGALISLPLFADTTWIRRFWDEEYFWEASGRCVIQTTGGGYMVYANHYEHAIGEKVWLLKTNPYGDTMWTRKYGVAQVSNIPLGPEAVQETSDGGYVFTASVMTVAGGHNDAWLCKVGPYGDMHWERTYGELEPAEYGKSVQQAQDGGYIITGVLYTPPAADSSYVLLLKTNSDGDTLWSRTYEKEEGVDKAWGGKCVQKTADKGFIISTGRGSQGGDLGLLKTDSLGNKEWNRVYEGKGGGRCVEQTTDGGYIVAADFAVVRTDSTGEIMWSRDFDGCDCARQTSDGGYIACGGPYLRKLDADGNLVWERVFEFGIGSVIQTIDGGYVLTGGPDVWIAKTDEEGRVFSGVDEKIIVQPSLKVVGSVGPEITLRYADFPQGFSASIFDASGRKVDELHASEESGTITLGEGYRPGVYFIKVRGKPVTQKVVITR